MAVVEEKPQPQAPKTDFERLREVVKTLSLSDISPIVLASISTIRDIGIYSQTIGNFEKKSKEAYDLISKLGQQPEAFLMNFVDKIPEDKLKPMLELSLRMVSLQTEMKDFEDLPADRKIELGQELCKVADGLTAIIGELIK